MTKRDIFSVSFKILGVISVMYAVLLMPSIGFAIDMVINHSEQGIHPYAYLCVAIINPILLLAMAYFLLKRGDLFAEKLARDNSPISNVGTIQWEKSVFLISLRIIGVLSLVRGIPQLVGNLTRLTWRYRGTYIWTQNIENIVLLVIGVYLLSSGNHLVRFAFRERTKTPPSIDK